MGNMGLRVKYLMVKVMAVLQRKKTAYTAVGVLLFVQIIILGSFLICSNGELYWQDDTSGYTIPAQTFLEQGKMLVDEAHPMIFRTPGYPLFLAAVYAAGVGDTATAVIQCILAAGVSLILYHGAALLTGKRGAGILCMLLYTLEFSHAVFAICILPDIVFGFLIVLSVWCVIYGIDKKRSVFGCLGAVCINLALLVKPTLMYWNILLCLLLAAGALLKKFEWKPCACYLLAFVCLFGGWSLRNYRETGYFLFSNIRYVQFFRWDGPELKVRVEGISGEEALGQFREELRNRYGIPYSDADLWDMDVAAKEKEIGNEYVSSHMAGYFMMNVEGLLHLLFRADGKYFESVFHSGMLRKCFSGVTVLTLAAVYFLYAAGFLSSLKRQNRIDWGILLLCMYLMAGTASLGNSRYRFAFLPLVILGMAGSWRHSKLLEER